MPGIVWLASYPKSGNTWLRAFIATYMRDPAQPLSINELRYYAFGDGFLEHYEKVTGREGRELSEDELRRYRPVMHRYLGSHPTDHTFVKTHNMVGDEGGVPIITPDITGGGIYVMRNPLDVVDSFAHHYDISYDATVDIMCTTDKVLPGIDGLKIPDFVGCWTQNVRSWTEAPGMRLHVMRYEDMRSQPGPTFRKLIQFLQLPVIPKRLTKTVRFTSFDELNKQENQKGFEEAPPDGREFFRKGQSGHWRELLTQEQVDRMVAAHGETMQRFGYLDKHGRPV